MSSKLDSIPGKNGRMLKVDNLEKAKKEGRAPGLMLCMILKTWCGIMMDTVTEGHSLIVSQRSNAGKNY